MIDTSSIPFQIDESSSHEDRRIVKCKRSQQREQSCHKDMRAYAKHLGKRAHQGCSVGVASLAEC